MRFFHEDAARPAGTQKSRARPPWTEGKVAGYPHRP